MASPVGISNEALGLLPADRIQSFDAASPEARECKMHYPLAKRHVLQRRSWTFLRTRELLGLTQIPAEALMRWAYAYARPAGVMIDALHRSPANGMDAAWDAAYWRGGEAFEIVGGVILTNAPLAVLFGRMTPDACPEAVIDDVTASAIAFELARRICLPITKSNPRYRELVAEAPAALELAMQQDDGLTPHRYGDFVPEALMARHA